MKNNGNNSKLSTVLVLCTCVIGIGNFYIFPDEVNRNGGGTFTLFYLLAVLFVAFPIFFSELIIGKNGQNDAVNAIEKLDVNKTFYSIGSKIGLFSSFLILMFCSIIAGWTLIYFYEGILYGYSSYLPNTASILLTQRINSFTLCLFTQLVYFLLISILVKLGVIKIYEKINIIFKVSMIGSIGGIIFLALSLNGTGDALKYLFIPNFEYVQNNFFDITLSAIRQSLFTLTLGTGVIITYGSYVRDEENVVNVSSKVVAINTLISIIGAVVIFTILNSFSISYGDTENIFFIAFLNLFNKSFLGKVVGCLFFFNLFLSIILLSVALLESIVVYLVNLTKIHKPIVTILVVCVLVILSVPLQPSLGVVVDFLNWTGETVLKRQIFMIALNFTIPLSVLITTLFTGFRLNSIFIKKEIKNEKITNVFILYMRYILPMLISVVFIVNLLGVVG